MIRRLPEILSIITASCLIFSATGCPTQSEMHVNKDAPTQTTQHFRTNHTTHREAVRATQPPEEFGCERILDDR